MKTVTTVVAVGICALAGAPRAFAEETTQPTPANAQAPMSASHAARAGHTAETAPAFAPSFAVSRASAVVDLWPTADNFSATFGGELQLEITRRLFLDLAYSAAFAHVGDAIDAGDYLGYGNPVVGVHMADSPSSNFSYFVGASVSAPVLMDPSAEVSNAAFYAQRIRGFYDADRFVRGHMAARVAVGMEWQAAGPLYLRGELRPVVYIPTSDRHAAFPEQRAGVPGLSGGDTVVTIEHALELELRSQVGLGAGVRLQGVMMPMRDDMIQTVAEPFVQFTPRRQGVFARIGAPLAIDEDLGPASSENKLAAIRFQIGGQW